MFIDSIYISIYIHVFPIALALIPSWDCWTFTVPASAARLGPMGGAMMHIYIYIYILSATQVGPCQDCACQVQTCRVNDSVIGNRQ